MAAISKVGERFTETHTEDEILIMRLDSGEFFALSGTAAAAWRLIDGARDRDSLVAALADEFTVHEEQIAPDIDELLHQLEETGLLASR